MVYSHLPRQGTQHEAALLSCAREAEKFMAIFHSWALFAEICHLAIKCELYLWHPPTVSYLQKMWWRQQFFWTSPSPPSLSISPVSWWVFTTKESTNLGIHAVSSPIIFREPFIFWAKFRDTGSVEKTWFLNGKNHTKSTVWWDFVWGRHQVWYTVSMVCWRHTPHRHVWTRGICSQPCDPHRDKDQSRR